MSVLLEFGEKNIILEATAEDFFKNISSAHSEVEVKSIKVSYDSKIAAAKRSFWMSYGKERAEQIKKSISSNTERSNKISNSNYRFT